MLFRSKDFSSRAVETYGTCKGERFNYLGFAIALFLFNLIYCFVGMLQALRCRFLVLEYNEMQWLQLSILPLFEAWIIGGPILTLVEENPTLKYSVFVTIISSSSIAAAFAVFASKEWFIRKNQVMAGESTTDILPRTSPGGLRVLKHPRVSKHIFNVDYRFPF